MKFVYLISILLIQSACGWKHAESQTAEAGLDEGILLEAVEQIQNGRFGEIHSLLIYKNDMLAFEQYFEGHGFQWDAPGFYGDYISWDKELPHAVHSVTKSITSLCIGMAVEQGFIKDIRQSIFDYLPEHSHLRTPGKDGITIEHLLTMTSGLEWIEWGISYHSPENPIIGIWYSDKDPVSFILEGELRHAPGTRYAYYGGNQILLGEILRNASGMPIDSFSQAYLFDPLGIEDATWASRFENGVIEAAGGLRMRPRDMLKIGVLMLQGGRWEGRQIIPESWIGLSARPYGGNSSIRIPGEDWGRVGYAFGWWTRAIRVQAEASELYFALGWGGQKIIVLPGLDMVVVFTGANYTSKVEEFRILEKFILPAIVSG